MVLTDSLWRRRFQADPSLVDRRPIFERTPANIRFIHPGYFRTLGLPLRHGRTIEEGDRKKNVVIVSEGTAHRLWPGLEDPIGRRFYRGDDELNEVSGVAGDLRASLQQGPMPTVYMPYWKGALLVAAAALLLASLGIYGVVSCSVARRTNEIGIRMALGARASDVLRMALRQGLTPVALGLAAGVAGALALGRILSSLLFGVSARDPVTIGAVVFVLAAVAVAACCFPALRAIHIDPMTVLRYE